MAREVRYLAMAARQRNGNSGFASKSFGISAKKIS
jgi:hypothetical protein